MNIKYFLAVSFLFQFISSAQNIFEGVLLDKATKVPVPNASILLMNGKVRVNDKYIDFVLALADDNDTSQRGLYFLKGDKDGFDLIKYSNNSNEFYHGITTGDINKDGKPDIVISGPTYFLMGNGDFTFTKTNWSTNLLEKGPIQMGDYFGSTCMDLIDLNKDGYLDLVRGFHNNKDDQPGNLYGKSMVINFANSFFDKNACLVSPT